MSNKNMHAAKKLKNDEFYTRIEDIGAELAREDYKKQIAGKVIYCNCDDPEQSAFYRYFKAHFKLFKVKKLISTHFDPDGNASYKLEFDGEKVTKTELEGNGDFRSEECLKLLDESDIVVTNPPFSLFREFVKTILDHGKDFIVIGNKNAITYKEIFPLIKNNKIKTGYSFNKTMAFEVPEGYAYNEKITEKIGDGKKYGQVPAIAWFTTLELDKHKQPLELGGSYKQGVKLGMYPKYDNYDAIEVSKVCNIPEDYDGVMGVPITFLDVYCPDQFEIVGLGNSQENFTPTKQYVGAIKHKKDGKTMNGNAVNSVLVIKLTAPLKGEVYYTTSTEILFAPYARILIKKKNEDNSHTI